MFIAALFTTGKTWKQSECPSTDEWIKKTWYIYIQWKTTNTSPNGIPLSHKKNEIMPFAATWMLLETVILSEVSQKEKDKYHRIPLTCGI